MPADRASAPCPAPTTPVGPPNSLGRPFHLLWAGQSLSLVGDQITLIAPPLLAVRTVHATTADVGALGACLRVPFLVLGLPAGVWVARSGLLRSMLGADLVGGTFLVGLGQGCFAVNAVTLRQLNSAAGMRPQATAIHRFVSWGALPLGSLAAGFLGTTVGLRWTMTVAAAVAALCFWPLLTSPLTGRTGPGQSPGW